MAIEAIADEEARAYLLTFLNQIEDFTESAYRVVEIDRQKVLLESSDHDYLSQFS